MSKKAKQSCPNCVRMRAQLDKLQTQFDRLQEQVRLLQEQLAAAKKNSSTSSKPPSSDIVQPPKPPPLDGANQRSIGGQPGHPKHERPLLPPTQTFDYIPPCCTHCGGLVQPVDQPPLLCQQIEVATPPLLITEHRAHAAFCPHCERTGYASWPLPIRQGGLLGPTLTTLVAYLKGVCHASFSTIRKFFRDVLNLTIARSELAKVIQRVSQALAEPYAELLEALPKEARLNVDETGHNENGQQLWTWCFRASLYTLFQIDERRSGAVLIDVLGKEFDGVLGCDFFGAYRRYMRECGVTVQFCLAHLIRDVKFLLTLPDQRDVAYGNQLLEALKTLFAIIHQKEQLAEAAFQRQLLAARAGLLYVARTNVPPTRHSERLAKRFTEYGESYVRFVTTPGVEPTNNVAEQAIRLVVLDRYVTQGTRSAKGRSWCERIWTVIATCTQQGRSIWSYLSEAVTAYCGGNPSPSLLPQS
jgi:transposase